MGTIYRRRHTDPLAEARTVIRAVVDGGSQIGRFERVGIGGFGSCRVVGERRRGGPRDGVVSREFGM